MNGLDFVTLSDKLWMHICTRFTGYKSRNGRIINPPKHLHYNAKTELVFFPLTELQPRLLLQ